MDSTLALGAFRIARGAGGEAVREREPRRAGEGRLVWNRNFCVLIDYRLWAAKSEGRPWVDHCLEQCIEQCIEQCLDHHPEPRSAVPRVAGRFSDSETSWVLAGGTEGSFLCSPSSRFSGRGGGVGSLPRAWRRVGVPGAAGA